MDQLASHAVDYTFCMLRPLATTAFVLFVSVTASAQGRVFGTVKDPDGPPVKGATVTAENPNVTSNLTTTSNARRRYAFPGLRGGTWKLSVEAPGFQPSERQSTTKTLGTNPAMDFELQPIAELAPLGPLAHLDMNTLQQQLTAAAQLEQIDKLDEAIAAYRDILAQVPTLTSVHLQLGVLFERKHENASAVSEYQAALKADPANTKARAALERLARQ